MKIFFVLAFFAHEVFFVCRWERAFGKSDSSAKNSLPGDIAIFQISSEIKK
jgi:hypothetical protein